MDNKVSVIIPVYNVEKYLKRCVNSVINQTEKNIEIILVDDGSTDSSGNLCDELEIKYENIKAYHKENGGLGSARNYGFSKSNGEYILFLDSDDFIEKNAVEKMMNFSEYDIVCCGFDRVDEETKKVYSKEMISMSFDELEINDDTIMEAAFLSPSGWGKLFKREVIEEIKFSENKKAIEDTLFYLEVIPRTKKIKYIKEILFHYMVRENSLIMSITEEKADLFEENLVEIKNKYIKNGYSEKYFNFLELVVFIHNCISIPSRLFNNKEVNMKKRIKHIKMYMNCNFKNWRKIKIEIKKNYFKKLAIYILINMYRINMVNIFFSVYNFMISKLKIDIKW